MLKQLINKFGTTIYIQIWSTKIRLVDFNTKKIFEDEPILVIDKTKIGASSAIGIGRAALSTARPGCEAVNPFLHPRVLFADFAVGEKLLQLAIKLVLPKKIFNPAPFIIFHPMEKTEGGLTIIENRALRELGIGAGARDVMIYQGQDLVPEGFSLEKLKSANPEWSKI